MRWLGAPSIANGKAANALGGQYIWLRPDTAGLAELAELIDAGRLYVEVAEVFELADAAEAYRALETGHVRGKIMVRVERRGGRCLHRS